MIETCIAQISVDIHFNLSTEETRHKVQQTLHNNHDNITDCKNHNRIQCMQCNEMIQCIYDVVRVPTDDKLAKLHTMLTTFYKKNPSGKAIDVVAGLVSSEYAKGMEISQLINDFLLAEDDKFIEEVMIKFS